MGAGALEMNMTDQHGTGGRHGDPFGRRLRIAGRVFGIVFLVVGLGWLAGGTRFI